jgi:hypothetical protein
MGITASAVKKKGARILVMLVGLANHSRLHQDDRKSVLAYTMSRLARHKDEDTEPLLLSESS